MMAIQGEEGRARPGDDGNPVAREIGSASRKRFTPPPPFFGDLSKPDRHLRRPDLPDQGPAR